MNHNPWLYGVRDAFVRTVNAKPPTESKLRLWMSWMFFSRLILLIPMVYTVKWKRNIYIGTIAHCLLNLIGTAVLFAQLLG